MKKVLILFALLLTINVSAQEFTPQFDGLETLEWEKGYLPNTYKAVITTDNVWTSIGYAHVKGHQSSGELAIVRAFNYEDVKDTLHSMYYVRGWTVYHYDGNDVLPDIKNALAKAAEPSLGEKLWDEFELPIILLLSLLLGGWMIRVQHKSEQKRKNNDKNLT